MATTGLIVGVPTRGAVSIDWMAYVMDLLSYLPNGIKSNFFYVRGREICEAREIIMDYALEQGARHLLMMDDDTFAPTNAILRLWNARKPVISGVVYSKSDPSMPMVFREDGEGPWVEIITAKKKLISRRRDRTCHDPHFPRGHVEAGQAPVQVGIQGRGRRSDRAERGRHVLF